MSNTLQQYEEALADVQPLTSRTPFLRTVIDADGFRVFVTDTSGTPVRYDADPGVLVFSDDALLPPATAALIAAPAILVYRVGA